MISVNPEWFWALAESLLKNGFEITENIIVLKQGADKVVKEGNRRIAIMKMAYGHIRRNTLDVPENIEDLIKDLSTKWKSDNKEVPCTVFAASESAAVDRIVTLTHGKGEKAGRDKWKTVTRARHNKIMQKASEPGLDLLEGYIKHGKNLTESQKERWGGDYPLTVLDEAMKKLAPRFGQASAREMADNYPESIKYKKNLESMLHDIGQEKFGFPHIRDKDVDYAFTTYGIPAIKSAAKNGGGSASGKSAKSSGQKTSASSASGKSSTGSTKTQAVAIGDQKAVIRQLNNFHPVGNNREKVVTLLKEIRTLRPKIQPIAFCFLLRSMFEISAKVYCDDHKKSPNAPATTKSGGKEQCSLIELLRNITKFMTNNNADKEKVKKLHGALAVMATPDGFLSVTSMNQLVHNTKFSVDETHICTLFGNIFPLLEEMNS